jgi:hypothetical protein
MQNLLAIFIVLAALALIVQSFILVTLFFQMRKTMERMDQFTSDLQTRLGPILTRMQLLLDDTQPRISEMVADAAHVVYLARGQAQKIDRILTDAGDRVRGQLLHADRILTGAMESVEDVSAKLRDGFWRPMQKASALVQGIKVGLDLLRSRRGSSHRSADGEPLEQEEELFI